MNGQNRAVYLVKRMVFRYFDDAIPQAAAALSFFLLFSLFPLLMFANALLAQLNISIDGIQSVLELLPGSLRAMIESYLGYLGTQRSVSLMVVGLALTLYFLSRAVRSMMRTVNDIYHIEIQRAVWVDVLISFAITAGFLLAVVGSFVLVVVGRTVLRLLSQYLPIPQPVLDLTQNASFWVAIAFVFVFLLLFNRVVPNMHLHLREIWPGAAFSLLVWLLASWAFSFYVDNMARYSVLYGSLGAIIVLMLWLYIVSTVLLMGPQLNHTLLIMRLYRMETWQDKET